MTAGAFFEDGQDFFFVTRHKPIVAGRHERHVNGGIETSWFLQDFGGRCPQVLVVS